MLIRFTVNDCARASSSSRGISFALRGSAQTFFGSGPKVERDMGKANAMSADGQPGRAAIPDDAQPHVFSAQENLVAVNPLRRGMLGEDARALLFRPCAVFVEERLRLAARTASRNRDAERAVRLHTNDVAAGATGSHEVDSRHDGRRVDAQKRETELHTGRIT